MDSCAYAIAIPRAVGTDRQRTNVDCRVAAGSLSTSGRASFNALFTHAGQSETLYSTSTVDVSVSGTSTIDYWAEVPSTQHWLHTTRQVVIPAPANDNSPPAATSTPPAANDNSPITPLSATGTDATTTAQ
jgi:hypothetical protein